MECLNDFFILGHVDLAGHINDFLAVNSVIYLSGVDDECDSYFQDDDFHRLLKSTFL